MSNPTIKRIYKGCFPNDKPKRPPLPDKDTDKAEIVDMQWIMITDAMFHMKGGQ